MQERLLETDDLDLSKALNIAKIHETNIEQMKLISSNDLHYVGSRRERKPAARQRYAAPNVRRTDGARSKTWRSPETTLNKPNAIESTLDKLTLLKIRLATMAGNRTTSPQCADRQLQPKVQLYDRGDVHNECMQSMMPTTICWTKSLPSDALQPV